MASTNIDYIGTYFQYKTLTKIHGEPTYETLQEIKDQLKTNAASVSSSLGGGQNGYLGLVLSPAEYTNVSPTPFLMPTMPREFQVPPGTWDREAARLLRIHTEALRVFREAHDIKQALIKQIVEAIEPTFIKSLRNTTTNTITSTIPDILQYLFRRYGKVTPDKLSNAELEVRTYVYNLQDPIIILFDKVEDLVKLAEAAEMPYTVAQTVNLGVQMIRNTHDFHQGLRDWLAKPAQDKTWHNFKLHFETEHDSLRDIRGITMQQAGFHQANYVADRVLSEVESVQDNVIQLLKKYDEAQVAPNDTNTIVQSEITMPTVMSSNVSATTDTTSQVSQAQANALSSQGNLQMGQMLAMIQAMQEDMKNIKNTSTSRRTNKTRRVDKYCWSHGACAHTSASCF